MPIHLRREPGGGYGARLAWGLIQSIAGATFLIMGAAWVQAAPYKCVDPQGRVSYSERPEAGKRCVQPVLPQVQVVPAPPPSKPSPASAASAAERDNELAEARRALEEARRRLAEQEVVRYGDERNYQRVLDRLKPYQDAVSQAEARLRALEQGRRPGPLPTTPAEK